MKENKTISVIDNQSKLQVIFTTAEHGQFVANIPLEIINMSQKGSCLTGLNILFHGKFSFLPDTWKEDVWNNASKDGSCHIPEDLKKVPELVKISMCITIPKDSDYRTPKWYNECEGKIYFNELNESK